MKRVLVVRQDNNGDVLLTGPAIRAIASTGSEVMMLCSARGVAAARILPGVKKTFVAHSPWIDAEPEAVTESAMSDIVRTIRDAACDEAIICTSFHQSALPTALLLRLAGVARIGAVSEDYPGSLLDIRHRVSDDIHEVERNMSLIAAMGYRPLPSDNGDLQITIPPDVHSPIEEPYVVVHPGATVSARTWHVEGFRATIALLAQRGYRVVITGSAAEAELTAACAIAHPSVRNFGGATSFATFCAIVRDARVVICGNTATSHVASAVGTPLSCIFPPTIPAVRFRPWHVDHELFGLQTISCAGCRARECPRPGHPCLAEVTPQALLDSVERLIASDTRPHRSRPVETPSGSLA